MVSTLLIADVLTVEQVESATKVRKHKFFIHEQISGPEDGKYYYLSNFATS